MNINAVNGTKVVAINLSKVVAKWGNNDDPNGVLEVGKTYTVNRTEIRSFRTKVELQEFPGKRFNSAHFE